jgi:hypothetical protein
MFVIVYEREKTSDLELVELEEKHEGYDYETKGDYIVFMQLSPLGAFVKSFM